MLCSAQEPRAELHLPWVLTEGPPPTLENPRDALTRGYPQGATAAVQRQHDNDIKSRRG